MKWHKYVTWYRVTKNKVVEECYLMMFLKAFFWNKVQVSAKTIQLETIKIAARTESWQELKASEQNDI